MMTTIRRIALATLIVSVILLITSRPPREDIRYKMEYAYFQGQKDALTGTVRIKQDSEGNWHWLSSPWSNNEKTRFNPN